MKDYFGYVGKICVVTGAASGMGKAAAEMLVDLGAKVYALDWADVNVEGIEKYIHTDLSKKESIDQAFQEIPNHVDSFFGIAGVSGAKCDFITTTKIDLISNKKEVFALNVSGESMINVGIYDGDIIIVERRNTARNGEIVVAMTEENEVTLKTFYKEKDHIRLQPENSTMDPIIVPNCEILGKVIGVFRKM